MPPATSVSASTPASAMITVTTTATAPSANCAPPGSSASTATVSPPPHAHAHAHAHGPAHVQTQPQTQTQAPTHLQAHSAAGLPSSTASARLASNAKSWLAAAAAPPRNSSKNGHVLHRTFHFSYLRRTYEKRSENYEQQIKNIASVSTVEEFWQVYVHLHRVSKLAPLTDYFLFQEGVMPMWEDEANRRGGRLAIRVTKAASPRAFEDLCLALIGEQFDTDDICGIACSVRVAENYLSIWLRDARDADLLARVEGAARRVLDLPHKSVIRDWSFKPHHVEHNGPS